MSREFSFWEREEWLKKPDLLIVGGGIVGASTAMLHKEKRPDHDVLIIDKGLVPEGASTRNAGFCCVGTMSEHLADMKIAGEETVLKRIERKWKGLNLLRETMGESLIGYEHTGGYEIFTDDKLFETCSGKAKWMNNELKNRLGIGNVYNITEYQGYPAIFNHVEGSVNSGMLMKELHQRISKMGVRVLWNCEAESVNPQKVMLKEGVEIHAKNVVIATNGFTKRLIDKPIKPARGFVFITKPIEGFDWNGTFNHNEGYVYFRNVGNRLLLGGARDLAKEEETTDQFGTNKKIRDYLISFANDIIKLPQGWEIDMEWSGIMGVTENKEPIIEEVEPGLFLAAGLSGMGIAIGMQVSKELVTKIENSLLPN